MEYFNENYLRKNKSMYICNSLIKHGYFNFSLTILEYCSPDKCLEREGYYLKLLNPEYNISQDPSAPMSGRTHSDKSKKKISDALIGSKHSDDTRKILSDIKKGNTHGFKKGQPKLKGSGKPSQIIEVSDIKNNQTTTYDSISAAAKALNIKQSTITNYILLNQQKPYKGIYTFKKV